jgi:hypothetical protein
MKPRINKMNSLIGLFAIMNRHFTIHQVNGKILAKGIKFQEIFFNDFGHLAKGYDEFPHMTGAYIFVICQSIAFPQISIIGFGHKVVSSENLIPSPLLNNVLHNKSSPPPVGSTLMTAVALPT